ncbi:histidine kinase [Hymenobacter sp. HD11105]
MRYRLLIWGVLWLSLSTGPLAWAQEEPGSLVRVLTTWWWRPERGAEPWRPTRLLNAPAQGERNRARQFWLRTQVSISPVESQTGDALLVLQGWHTATEVYWDGQLLQRNGRLGPVGEQPGQWQQLLLLPPHRLRAGLHTLLVRVSDQQFAHQAWQPDAALITVTRFMVDQQRAGHSAMLIIGLLGASALFCLLLYAGFQRRLPYLFLSGYCALHALKIYVGLRGTDPDVRFPEYYLLNSHLPYLALLAGDLCLLVFLVLEFRLPRARWWVLPAVAFSGLAFFWVPVSPYFVAFTGVMVAAAGRAVGLGREGSWWALAGILGLTALTYLGYLRLLPLGYYWGIVFFIVSLAFSVGRQLVQQNRVRQQAMLRSARLENALLRKNIQPHFLLNTLMSLQELIEESPRQANQLIDALAEEFDMVSQMAEEKLVPMEDELQLCRTHLRIMGFRRQSEFVLETRGLLGTEQVPPATFHTLIENGLTHGYTQRGAGRFVLTKETLPRGIRYRLFNDSDAAACGRPVVEGTGSRYVKSRLEESFPGAWRLTSAPVTGGWAVEIDILDSPS